MQLRGYETFDYGNFDFVDYTRGLLDSVKTGWFAFDGRPRQGTTYVGLRGRIGILSESYAHDVFEKRLRVTRAFVEEILSFVAGRADQVQENSRRGDESLKPGRRVSIRSSLTKTPFQAPVPVEVLVAAGDSVVSERGVPRGVRRTGRFRVLEMPIYDRFVSALDVEAPRAYVLGAGDTAAVRVLRMHGIGVERVQSPLRADVETFTVDSTWTDTQVFQGHHQRGVVGHWTRSSVTIAAGSYLVRASEPLVVYLLEPESDDGLVTWNVFDAQLALGQAFPVRRVRS
jgi:hypothetical protein